MPMIDLHRTLEKGYYEKNGLNWDLVKSDSNEEEKQAG